MLQRKTERVLYVYKPLHRAGCSGFFAWIAEELPPQSRCAPRGQFLLAGGCSLLTPKENQKSASDFDALEPRKRGCSPLLTPKGRATPEKTEDSRLFGVKIF